MDEEAMMVTCGKLTLNPASEDNMVEEKDNMVEEKDNNVTVSENMVEEVGNKMVEEKMEGTTVCGGVVR